MKWRNIKDQLPEDGEEVLIRANGKYLLGIFEKQTKLFKLRTGGTLHSSADGLQWTRLLSP
jgi:hypothetical protein